MPLPRPKRNQAGEITESQSDFVLRCISSQSIQNEFNTQDQRLGVCYSLWEAATEKSGELEEHYCKIEKKDPKHNIVKGIVYTAGYVDTDGETVSKQDIQNAAWSFLAEGKVLNIDIQHNYEKSGCYVVESYMTEEGDPHFPADSWVIAVKCTDEIFEKVESGELNGFSFGGTAVKYPKRALLEVAKDILGETEENLNKDVIPAHKHNFHIMYNTKGDIVKAVTDVVYDHSHTITYGTATDKEISHSHRIDLNGE